MARLVLFQPDARSAARLTGALGDAHELVSAETWEDVAGLLSAATYEGCLLDADHPTAGEAVDRIAALRARHPTLALVGYTDRDAPLEYYRLGASGLDGVVTGADGPIRTQAVVGEALALGRGRRVAWVLEPHVPEPLPRLVGWAVAHAGPDATVERLARDTGHSPRALRDMLRARALPSPASLLLWGRLVSAGMSLHLDGRSIEETAFALGYAAANSLARAIRTQTGLTPGELVAGRGADRVLEAFVADVVPAEPPARIHLMDHRAHG